MVVVVAEMPSFVCRFFVGMEALKNCVSRLVPEIHLECLDFRQASNQPTNNGLPESAVGLFGLLVGWLIG